MAIALALSFFPLLVFPIELIFVLKVFAFLGYRKISPCAIFDNHNRQKIYDAVRVNPAILFSELSRTLSRSYDNKLWQPRSLTGPIAIQPPHDLPLPLNLCNKFLLAREIEGIPGCKELAAVIEN